MRTRLAAAAVLLIVSFSPFITSRAFAVTDSTARIQALFDAPGSTVTLPAGTFTVGCTAPLVLPSNKVVRGAGAGATTLLACAHQQAKIVSLSYTGNGPYTVLVKVEGNFSLPNWNAYDQVSVANIYGAPQGYNGGLGNPVIVAPDTIRFVTKDRPSVTQGTGGVFSAGIYPIQAYDFRKHTASQNLTIEDVTFSGNCPPTPNGECVTADRNGRVLALYGKGVGVAANPHNLVFRNDIVRDSWEDAIRIDSVGGTISSGYTFDHDQFLNAGWNGIEMYGISNFVFTNNRVINYGWNSSTSDALAFRGNGGGIQTGYTITGNFIQSPKNPNNFALEAAGNFSDAVDQFNVTGNTFDANNGPKSGNGISIIVESGKVMDNHFIHGVQQNHRDGFEFGCISCEVAGNSIDGGTIQIRNYCANQTCVKNQGIDIHDNVINQTATGLAEYPAIGIGGAPANFGGSLTNVKIIHNTITQNIAKAAPGNVMGIGLGLSESSAQFTPIVNLTVEDNTLRQTGSNTNTTAFVIYGAQNNDAASSHWVFKNNTSTGYAVHARAIGVNVAGNKVGSVVSDLKFEDEKTDHPENMFIDQSGGSQQAPKIIAPEKVAPPHEEH